MYYGLANKRQVVELSSLVCSIIGNKTRDLAVPLLVETCAAETLLGTARDGTIYGAGTGVAQVDSGTFVWLRKKYGDASHPIAQAIYKETNIKLDRVQYCELEYSPLLALIFARLRYLVVPAGIPETIEGRAEYWKEHYNTVEGKGTPEEYLSRCKASGVGSVLDHAFL